MTLGPEEIKAAWTRLAESGQWAPPPGDALYKCKFERSGFRSYSLSAEDGTWKLLVSRLDFGNSDPKALLEVYAPGHDAAFPDLSDFVFKHSIGVNGGTNMNQAVKQLHITLGANEEAWRRRINYLLALSQKDSAGRVNGSFVLDAIPALPEMSPYLFESRIRRGRTMSLFGPGGAGKTTVATALLISLLSGQEVVPGWRPTGTFNTLTLDWDEGREEEAVRLRAICAGHDIAWSKTRYHYKRMGRPLPDSADSIGRYIADHGVDVVLISPVGRAIRENEHLGPAAAIDELYEVLREFGTTNILIDHVPGASLKIESDREYGSVRKRDNARGSYSIYSKSESEEPGSRIVIIRNKKADALAPFQPPAAIRVEFDPPWPKADGSYDTIAFFPDQVGSSAIDDQMGSTIHMKEMLYDILTTGHRSLDQLVTESGFKPASVRACLYRYRGQWFGQLPSKAWEALPRPGL